MLASYQLHRANATGGAHNNNTTNNSVDANDSCATNTNTIGFLKRRRHSISTSTLLLKPTDTMTDFSGAFATSLVKRLPLAPPASTTAMRRAAAAAFSLPMPTLPGGSISRKMEADLRRHSFFTPPPSSRSTAAATVATSSAPSPVKVLCAAHNLRHPQQHDAREPEHVAFISSLALTKPSSQTSLSAAPRELPILHHKYVARNVRVAIGPSWKLQRFDVKDIRLQTGATPTFFVFSTPERNDDNSFGLPSDTTCTMTSGNGIKLKSRLDGRVRLRIRFTTQADALIWSKLVHDALYHAQSLHEFEEIGCLASDCMSRVVVARHVHTKQERVIKVLQNVRANDGSCSEVMTLKKLFPVAHNSKPLAFLTDYRVVETEKDVHIIMPRHSGKTLLQFLSDRPRPQVLSETEARMATWRICEQLHALHQNGIVHCDLKLENVLVTADVLDARVIDFGGAYDMARPNNNNHQQKMVGTPGYIAPERILRVDDAPTPAADLFSLGILLYQVLVGQHPFTQAGKRQRRLTIDDTLSLDWARMERRLQERNVSVDAQQLVKQLVVADPIQRITLDKVFQHPWFTK